MAAPSSRQRVRRGISIIGFGKWGTSLASAVSASDLPLVEIVTRTDATPESAFGLATTPASQARFDAELLWLCVPDRSIVDAASEIVRCRPDLRGQAVVHSSGALTGSILDAVRRAGGRVGSIAPIQTFSSREVVSLAGVRFVIEAPVKKDAIRFASLAKKLGGVPVEVKSEKKALYHAGATMASPLLISALAAASGAIRAAGIRDGDAAAVVGALASSTLNNYLERGAEKSFSGAFDRGDAGTVELHLKALARHPLLHEVYQALARNAVASLPVRNRPELERAVNLSADSRKRAERERLNAAQRMG